MSTPPKESDTKDVVDDEGHLKDDNQHSVVDVQNDHDMASPQSKGDSKSSHPRTPTEQDTSPTLPKQSSDDADTNSTLSGVPSPSVTHRPSSSKTSLDDRPPSPSNTSEKQTETSSDTHKGEDPKPDLDASTTEQPMAKEGTPDRKETDSEPSEPPSLSKKVATVLELNSELLRVYNEFHSQNQVHAFPAELRE
ncbi:hypothetical protein CPB86DRAFT_193182 [Serendipita vermifera]|nr:hypothetical protein CPB86DRAFT_193182 [Serendipita vermifera]